MVAQPGRHPGADLRHTVGYAQKRTICVPGPTPHVQCSTAHTRQGAGPAIQSYDAEHGTAYATTVLSYLAANSDVAAAARRLNVHPNTCRYRLARAEEISGITFGNPDERLLLWLQLRLSDQLGA